MNTIAVIGFGDPDAARRAKAGSLAYERAIKLGHGRLTALQFARKAKREACAWEEPEDTAVRIVRTLHASATTGPGRPTPPRTAA